MFDSSEDAIEANEPISFAAARLELRRHQTECRECPRPGFIEVEAVYYKEGDDLPTVAWEAIPCTSRAVLIWLGY